MIALLSLGFRFAPPQKALCFRLLRRLRRTAKVPTVAGAHHTPAQYWPITHRIINIAYTQDTLFDQTQSSL